MNLLERHRRAFKIDELIISENEYWWLSLRPVQLTPFSLVLSAKREVFKMSELTEIENVMRLQILSEAERFIYADLGASRINYYTLMMKDPIVHTHIFPRFERSLFLDKNEFIDVYYPKPVDILDSNSLDLEIFKDYCHRKNFTQSNFKK